MPNAWLIASALIGYLLGSLPFGYLVARAHGVDIFKAGSGNPGATNVKRVLGERFGDKGKRAGNLVFVLDALKGALAAGWPVLDQALGGWKYYYFPDLPKPDWVLMSVIGLIAAVLGHSFSIFTKFKGGKGVATAAGGVLVLMPVPCLVGVGVWLASFYTTRYVSLGSVLAAVVVPATGWVMGYPLPLNLVVTAIGLFVIVRHRENIKRLLHGTESKFARKPPA
jgi:acyl phosphate:glycerol-3-phosphate acyltransferase